MFVGGSGLPRQTRGVRFRHDFHCFATITPESESLNTLDRVILGAAMNLTKRQRQGLELTLRFHTTRPPSVGGLLLMHAPAYSLLLVFCVTLSVGMFIIRVPLAGAFCLGMLAGATLRIIRSVVEYVRQWPMTDLVTNWDLVAALVQPPAPADTPAAPPELKP